jgi:uncharacterized protein (DUF1330 family)
MPAYFLYDLLEVTDDAKFNEYREKVFTNVEQFGGIYRTVGGDQHVLEGEWKLNFPVIIEFDDKEKAMRWYNSPEYAPLKALRLAASKGNGILIDGDVRPAN